MTSFPSPPPLSFANGKVQERGGRRANADFRTRGFFSKEVSWLVGGCRGEEKGDPPLLTVVRAIKQSGGGAQGIPAKTQKRERRKKLSCFFFGRRSLSLTVATCLPVAAAVFSCSKPCDAPVAEVFFVCLGGFPQKDLTGKGRIRGKKLQKILTFTKLNGEQRRIFPNLGKAFVSQLFFQRIFLYNIYLAQTHYSEGETVHLLLYAV